MQLFVILILDSLVDTRRLTSPLDHMQNVNFLKFNTNKDTHWKQTVFYLKEDVAVTYGDHFTGFINVYSNELNPRDYDVELEIDFDGKVTKSKQSQHYVVR
jgi:hypothetical protein